MKKDPLLVTIPVEAVHEFKGVDTEAAYLINVPDASCDYQIPEDIRISPHDPCIPDDWALKEG